MKTLKPEIPAQQPVVTGAEAFPSAEDAHDVGTTESVVRPDTIGFPSHTDTPEGISPGPDLARPSRTSGTTRFWQDRRTRGLIAGAASLVLFAIALWSAVNQSPTPSPSGATGAATPTGATTPTGGAASQGFAPAPGPALSVLRVIGADAGLAAPRGAVALPNRRIAVADTGHGRLVILDREGRVVRATQASGLAQPFALASDGRSIYVLDARQGTIKRYNIQGRYSGELLHNPNLLGDGRGLAIASGALYVANPRANSIAQFALPGGKLVRTFTSPGGAAEGDHYAQPSDVAVDPEGDVYSAEVDGYIKMRQSTGAFIQRWPIPGFVTIDPVRVLPLGPGRLLATDPSGALLSYVGTNTPTRYPLLLHGKTLTNVEPLGLDRMPDGNLLVVDTLGNRLLVVHPPQ